MVQNPRFEFQNIKLDESPSLIDEYLFMCRWDSDGMGETVTFQMLEDMFGPCNVQEMGWASVSTDINNPNVRVLLMPNGVHYHPETSYQEASFYVYSNLPVSIGI
jgi:hypothetical protein